MKKTRIIAPGVLLGVTSQENQINAQELSFWHTFEVLDSSLSGRDYKIVFAEKPNENRDWIWRARFWGHEPQTDLALPEQRLSGGLTFQCDGNGRIAPVSPPLHPVRGGNSPCSNRART